VEIPAPLSVAIRLGGLLFGVGLSVWTAVPQEIPPQSCAGVRLEIAADATVLRVGERPQVRAGVVNESKTAVALVLPGDGSSVGWRTPIVGWSVLNADDRGTRPSAPPVRGSRDGNINPLTAKDLLTLEPGTSAPLGDWLGSPSFPSPGAYRVVFYYRNIPDLSWKGITLGQHNAAAMKQVGRTAPCSLVSNELHFTVR
jgi:hypothetical protein